MTMHATGRFAVQSWTEQPCAAQAGTAASDLVGLHGSGWLWSR